MAFLNGGHLDACTGFDDFAVWGVLVDLDPVDELVDGQDVVVPGSDPSCIFVGPKVEAKTLFLLAKVLHLVLVMMNLDKNPAFGGIMENPFYTTFTVILLASTAWLLFRMISGRRYIRGFVLGIFFCLQIFVIMFNVSGTFTIDINQRYVLVALPLFALLMALGMYDALLFATKMKTDAAAKIVMGVAVALSVGLMLYHAPSYKANMRPIPLRTSGST